MHTHSFEGATTVNDSHRHFYSGITSAVPDIPGHTHYMSATTTYNDGHTHRIEVSTGPEIETGGGHTHYYRGMTTYSNGHIHYFDGYTSIY